MIKKILKFIFFTKKFKKIICLSNLLIHSSINKKLLIKKKKSITLIADSFEDKTNIKTFIKALIL